MEFLLAAVELVGKYPDFESAENARNTHYALSPPQTVRPTRDEGDHPKKMSQAISHNSLVGEESQSVSSSTSSSASISIHSTGKEGLQAAIDRSMFPEDYFVSIRLLFEKHHKLNIPPPDISENTYLTFPQKLYLLNSYDCNRCVEWCADGTSFCILKKQTLVSDVIPRYFKQTDFRSFTRQINVYGFTRFRMSNISEYCYRHPHFQKGRPELLLAMFRRKPSFKRGADRRSLEKKHPKKQKRDGDITSADDEGEDEEIAIQLPSNVERN